MPNFVINLDSPLKTVIPKGSPIPPDVNVESRTVETTRSYGAGLVATAKAIEESVLRIRTTIESQQNQIETFALAFATEFVRTVLGTVDELIQQRLERAVSLALEDVDSELPPKVFVHPSCLQHIQAWLSSNTEFEIEVLPDEALIAGDCRVEFGNEGLLASLDSQLELIQTKLLRSISGGGDQ